MIGTTRNEIRHVSHFISNIIDSMSSGEIRLYDGIRSAKQWTENEILLMFDSIYNNIPIGNILLFETKEHLKNKSLNIRVQPYDDKTEYVLDGQERLKYLFWCLHLSSKFSPKWDIYFDLEKDTFCFLSHEPENTLIVPIRILLSTTDVLRHNRLIASQLGDRSSVYIEKIDNLCDAFRNYQISITILSGRSLESALLAHSRIVGHRNIEG